MMSEASSLAHGGPAACHLRTVRVGGPGVELGEGRAPRSRRSLQHHDLLEGFESGHVGQQRHQVGAEQVGHGEEQARPRGAQDVARFLAAVSGVERHQHGTDRVDGEARDHPCGAVGCPEGHAVAALDAARPRARAPRGRRVRPGPETRAGSSRRRGPRRPRTVRRLLQRLGDRPRLPITRCPRSALGFVLGTRRVSRDRPHDDRRLLIAASVSPSSSRKTSSVCSPSQGIRRSRPSPRSTITAGLPGTSTGWSTPSVRLMPTSM